MGHSFFAPSSAPRVVRCPASLLLTMNMPDKGSVDAAHGTAAHWIADKCLREEHMVERYAGCNVAVHANGECEFVHIGNSDEMTFSEAMVFEVDDEMVEAVQEYVDWCNELPGEHYAESRVDISKYCPEIPEGMIFLPAEAYESQGGTSDHAACDVGTLVITDLKYGKGVRVFAHENEQAILYALGFIEKYNWVYDFEKIVIRICQPRLDHKDVWETTREELEALGRYILERFTLALQPDAPFGPSDKACKFCKLSGQCRAQRDYLTEVRTRAFDDLTETHNPAVLNDEELVEAWRSIKLFNDFHTGVVRELLRRAEEEGAELPGVKIVESVTHRRWRDPDAAADVLRFEDVPEEEIFKSKLVSPAQAEELLGRKKKGVIAELVEKPIGEPCIVEASDRRADLASARQRRVELIFDDLDNS